MSQITNVRTGSVASISATGAPTGASAKNLLPAPAPLDAYSVFYLLTSKERNQSTESAKSGSITQREEQKANIEKADAELKAQREAEESKSFWDTLGDIFSVVTIAVTAVASVATGGALAFGACALSAAAFTEDKTQFLEKCGVDPGIAQALTLGCAAGSMVAGGVLLLENATTPDAFSTIVSRTSRGMKAGSDIGSAVTKFGSTVCNAKANTAFTRSEEATMRLEHAERATEGIVKAYGHIAKSYERALQGIVTIVSEQSQTTEALARGIA